MWTELIERVHQINSRKIEDVWKFSCRQWHRLPVKVVKDSRSTKVIIQAN